MVRRILAAIPFVLLSLALPADSQTVHTFTFGLFGKDPNYGSANGCAVFQTLDGIPANQAVGYSGSVCVPYNFNPWWGMIAPQGNPDGTYGGWGYPNNGFLTNNNNEPGLSAPIFVDPNCNLKTSGCVDYETGSSDFVGYGLGVHVDLIVWFKVTPHRYCGRTGCHIFELNDETNGSGTTSYTPPQ